MTSELDPVAPLADLPQQAEIAARDLLSDGFRPYERFKVSFPDGDHVIEQVRDVLRAGAVVGVLPVDVARDEVVLIRQFRLPAHLANGCGEMVEVPAGYVEPGETPEAAGARECLEEIGVAPGRLFKIAEVMPAPGSTDEIGTLYAGAIDAAAVCVRGGVDEGEVVRPFRVRIDAAIAALDAGHVRNSYLIICLQWLALNRHRLGALFT